jgi:hypothetical protein
MSFDIRVEFELTSDKYHIYGIITSLKQGLEVKHLILQKSYSL